MSISPTNRSPIIVQFWNILKLGIEIQEQKFYNIGTKGRDCGGRKMKSEKNNIQILTNYINKTKNPQLFINQLFSLFEPRLNEIPNGHKKMKFGRR